MKDTSQRRATAAVPATRRSVIAGLAGAVMLPANDRAAASGPAIHRAPEHKYLLRVDAREFALPDTGLSATEPISAAIAAARAAGVPLQFPRGSYRFDAPLRIHNASGRDEPMPDIVGAGVGGTRLQVLPFPGAFIDVRGVGKDSLKQSHFLRGGSLARVEIEAIGARDRQVLQHGLAVTAWWGGSIDNVRISGFSGHGIHSVGDVEVSTNPDWTACVLSLSNLQLQRLGGWGFLDDNPIGSPGWVWSRVVFGLSGAGGACVRSSGHDFRQCSWNIVGFPSERRAAAGEAVGLHLDGAPGRTISRTRVIAGEFDASKDVHLAIDHADACTIEQTRFIHNDRNEVGRITPSVGVSIAHRGEGSRCQGLRVRQSIFRIDTPGDVVGFDWRGTANVSDLEIDGVSVSFADVNAARFTAFRGFDARNAHVRNDYRLRTASEIVATGRSR